MITQMSDMREFMDQVAIYKYIIRCIHDELLKRSHDCGECTDIDTVRRKLDALLIENNLSLTLRRDS